MQPVLDFRRRKRLDLLTNRWLFYTLGIPTSRARVNVRPGQLAVIELSRRSLEDGRQDLLRVLSDADLRRVEIDQFDPEATHDHHIGQLQAYFYHLFPFKVWEFRLALNRFIGYYALFPILDPNLHIPMQESFVMKVAHRQSLLCQNRHHGALGQSRTGVDWADHVHAPDVLHHIHVMDVTSSVTGVTI